MLGGEPGGRPLKRPAVVLDARAEADFEHHLDVEPRAGVEPLGFEQLALRCAAASSRSSSSCLIASIAAGDALLGHDEVLGRIDEQLLFLPNDFAAGRIDDRQLLDLVAEQLDPQAVFLVGRPQLDAIAADAKLAAREIDVVPLVLHVDQLQQQFVAIDRLAATQARSSSPCNRRANPSRRCTKRWPR